MATLLVLNGPNLNLLGTRQPEVYGSTTLEDIESTSVDHAASVGVSLTFFQSNHEGELIDQIHAAKGRFDGILMNAGAYSHTSIAIMDAISSVEVPTIDIHLSNIHARESFRHTSYIAKVAIGSIVGFGPGGYLLAIDAMMMHLDNIAVTPVESPASNQEIPQKKALPEQVKETPAPIALTPNDHVDMAAEAVVDDDVDDREQAEENPATESEDKQAYAAAAAAAIASQARARSKPESEEEGSANSNPAFNEMFETPPKEVLDSLGISAPELRPVTKPISDQKTFSKTPKKTEAEKPSAAKRASAQIRNFRKLS